MTISLVLVTSINHELAEFSLRKSIQSKKFDEVLIFSDKKIPINHPHRHISISNTFSRTDYSIFCLKHMYQYIETDHVLIVQPDGMAVNSQYWDDDFLNYDYIGPPYNINETATNEALVEYFGLKEYKNVNKWIVGNGGFSLRTRKLMIHIIQNYQRNPKDNEDVYFSRIIQDHNLGIFPTMHEAYSFSSEGIVSANSFGGHCYFNYDVNSERRFVKDCVISLYNEN